MKTCNFPERKNQRRKGAYQRLLDGCYGVYFVDGMRPDLTVPVAILNEAHSLETRIVDSARHERSKKRRNGKRNPNS
jgi:hypothetical protein